MTALEALTRNGVFRFARDVLTRKHWLSPYLAACFFLVDCLACVLILWKVPCKLRLASRKGKLYR